MVGEKQYPADMTGLLWCEETQGNELNDLEIGYLPGRLAPQTVLQSVGPSASPVGTLPKTPTVRTSGLAIIDYYGGWPSPIPPMLVWCQEMLFLRDLKSPQVSRYQPSGWAGHGRGLIQSALHQ